jgi:FkbM family methyltransferase
VGPCGRVFAFEPFHSSAEAFKANALRNEFAHVDVFEVAVDNAEGAATFQLAGTVGEFRLLAKGERAAGNTFVVPVVSIDDLLERGEVIPPDFVVIDVEGAELQVLQGLTRTIAQRKPVIVCEVHGPENAFVDTCAKLSDSASYSVSRLDDQNLLVRPEGRSCRDDAEKERARLMACIVSTHAHVGRACCRS